MMKSEKHGIAYAITEFNGVPHLNGRPIMKDGSLSESEFEVDLVNAFNLEEIAEFRVDMKELFNNDPRIDAIFDCAVETYKLYLTSNMD